MPFTAIGDDFLRRDQHFRERDGVIRGGDATSGAEITSSGVTVTPYNWPQNAVLDRGQQTDATGVVAGAPLRLATTRIARASTPASSRVGARTVRVAPDGTAEMIGGEGTEIVRNVDGGIEQSWRFEAAPLGDGDLTVRVAASGQAYGGRTSSGLHFFDPATGLGFRYSDAVWIDADGRRVALNAGSKTARSC